MKNKKWIVALIILLTILMVVLTITFVVLLKNGSAFKKFKIGLQSSNELIIDKTYEEKFNMIMIEASTSEIFIKKSDGDTVRAIIYGKKEDTKVETTLDAFQLKISEESCIGFCFQQKAAKVEIYLPADFNGNIAIKNEYGDIFVDEFLNAQMNIEEDCGDVKILGGNIIKVDNNYGDIEIEKSNVSTIKEDCGDVIISNAHDVTVENSYGNIKIQSVDNYLHLKNDCGDIEINNIHLKKNSYIKDDYGDIKIGATNELFIDAKTDLGKVKINNNYNQSDIILKIENDCGDIEVNN